jgi:glycosyltransferase involved in cell wall biosynthesis
VFANTDAQALELDETYVTRCWMRGQERYPELAQAILAKGAKIAIVQSQPGLMSLSGLCDLLAALQAGQVATYVTLHNTRDWFAAEAPSLTGGQRHALSGATRLLVHTLEDMNRLKRAGFIDNVVYFPHGIYDSPKPEQMTAKSYWQIPEASPVIATFGFLMPHKGQQVLLEALAQLPPPYDQTHLLMLNTVLPEPGSQGEWQACQEKINALGLQARVHVETQFLVEAVALQHLAMADAIVFPYQYTKESASGAVRMGLATRRPVVVTPLAIFDDVAPVSYRLAGTDVTAITNGLLDLLGKYRGNGAIPEFLDQAHQMLAARDWVMLSKRLKNMVEGEYFDVFGPDLLSSITT